jgi:hypothetical protein
MPFLRVLILEIYNSFRLFYNLLIFEQEKLSKQLGLNINYNNIEYRLHTNASGDFLMMHRDGWFKIKGHPENTYLSIHTDAISVAMARYSGLKEKSFSILFIIEIMLEDMMQKN